MSLDLDLLEEQALELEKNDTPYNRERLRNIYSILQNDVPSDYWRETMAGSPNWVIDIVAETLTGGLDPGLIVYIPDVCYFKKYLYILDPEVWKEEMLECVDESNPEQYNIVMEWIATSGNGG